MLLNDRAPPPPPGALPICERLDSPSLMPVWIESDKGLQRLIRGAAQSESLRARGGGT